MCLGAMQQRVWVNRSKEYKPGQLTVLGKMLLSSLVEKNPSMPPIMMAINISTWLRLGLIPQEFLTLSQRLLKVIVLL